MMPATIDAHVVNLALAAPFSLHPVKGAALSPRRILYAVKNPLRRRRI
jgi:hypothetical protein